ncbi:MAG: HAD-IA family hydrolase [Actinomycetia bacterium]|nr:HAD-IA family hydrolase [Actinomycetes bacterium]
MASANRAAGIDAVLFDWDGTLMDTWLLVEASYRYALGAIGRAYDRPLTWYVTRRLGEVFGDDADGRRGQELYRSYYLEHSPEMARPFPGLDTALRRLRTRGVRVGIVTNKERRRLDAELDRSGFAPWVDFVVTTEETLARKPEADPLVWATVRYGLGPAVYVGDSPVDLTAGRLAGMKPVAVGWSRFDRSLLERRRPWRWAPTPEDVVKVLDDPAADADPGSPSQPPVSVYVTVGGRTRPGVLLGRVPERVRGWDRQEPTWVGGDGPAGLAVRMWTVLGGSGWVPPDRGMPRPDVAVLREPEDGKWNADRELAAWQQLWAGTGTVAAFEPTRSTVAEMLDRLDERDGLGLCLDTARLARTEYDVADAVAAAGEYVTVLRIRDANGLAPGWGPLDWDRIQRAWRGLPQLRALVLDCAWRPNFAAAWDRAARWIPGAGDQPGG